MKLKTIGKIPWKKSILKNKPTKIIYFVSKYYSLDILTTLNHYVYWYTRNFTTMWINNNKNRNSFPLYLCCLEKYVSGKLLKIGNFYKERRNLIQFFWHTNRCHDALGRLLKMISRKQSTKLTPSTARVSSVHSCM